MLVRALRGAENRGACGAAELRERVGNGRQGGWTQLLLFLQAPTEGDTHAYVTVLADQRKTDSSVYTW